MSRIQEIRARLAAATPGPWAWGKGWLDLDYQGADGGGDKYADLQLLGSAGQEIIPLRIDHYEPIWDCFAPNEGPTPADRDLIAHAPEDLAWLIHQLSLWSAILEENL